MLFILVYSFFTYLSVRTGVRYDHVKPLRVVQDQGNNIGSKQSVSLRDCESLCFTTSDCKSFSYCSHKEGYELAWNDGSCWTKDKVFDGSEKIEATNDDCTSYYESPSMLLIILNHFCMGGKPTYFLVFYISWFFIY